VLQGLPLFWQAAIFTGLAAALIALTAWWLYLSPLKVPVAAAQRPSRALAGWVAALLGLGAFQLVAGGFWDSSMHILTGRVPAGADFLWPPHIMIYSSFALSFLVALIAVAAVALGGWRAGERDPRQWVRRNPYLGIVALASGYALLSIPGDALWHALFGIDLTAWSPPHVLIGLLSCAVIVSALGLILQSRPERSAASDAAILALLALMLNVAYLVGVVEWEVPGRSILTTQNPIWVYPVVGGALALFACSLARRLTAFRWAATFTALGFYAVRYAIMLGLGLTQNVVPFAPLWFILGAVLLDVLPWRGIVPEAAAFTAGFTLLALPLLSGRANLAPFRSIDLVWAVAVTLLVSLLLIPLASAAARRLVPQR
jgi:hypothetical protein